MRTLGRTPTAARLSMRRYADHGPRFMIEANAYRLHDRESRWSAGAWRAPAGHYPRWRRTPRRGAPVAPTTIASYGSHTEATPVGSVSWYKKDTRGTMP